MLPGLVLRPPFATHLGLGEGGARGPPGAAGAGAAIASAFFDFEANEQLLFQIVMEERANVLFSHSNLRA
jgi:hypothetical protein